jgi:hypothetical protein
MLTLFELRNVPATVPRNVAVALRKRFVGVSTLSEIDSAVVERKVPKKLTLLRALTR